MILRTAATTALYPDAVVTGPFFNTYHGRWYVYVRYGKIRLNMLLSRFLMQEHLGRILDPREHVHHRDDDKTNDVISNFEVLWLPVHSSITKHEKNETVIIETCLQCKHEFEMDNVRQNAWRQKQNQGKNGPFCSVSCANRYRARKT